MLLASHASSPAQAGDPVRRSLSIPSQTWNTESPACAGDDNFGVAIFCAYAAGTGNAVTDLIFSIAKREVTFFSGTALISFL